MATAVAIPSAFDQWQKDFFFPAAEAVQESTDRLESIYRIWIKDRSGGFKSEISDQLRRELQTALGTAKWQLEEFEKAVKRSYDKCSLGNSHIERHSQFVAALQNQIGHVEKSLGDTLREDGKQPFRWVQLDDEERDDLATFLSTGSRKLKSKIDKSITNDDSALLKPKPKNVRGFKETLMGSDDSKYIVELDAGEFSKGIDKTNRTISLPDIASWKIVIGNELNVNNTDKTSLENKAVPRCRASNLCSLMKNVGKTTQLKWPMNLFRKEKSDEHLYYVDRGVSSYLSLKKRFLWLTRGRNGPSERNGVSDEGLESSLPQPSYGWIGGGFRRQYSHTQFSPSLILPLVLMLMLLSIFLFVPFVFN